MTDRENYMLDALRAIASCGNGQEPRIVLRPYMDEHGINWLNPVLFSLCSPLAQTYCPDKTP